jgi:hypothetical protein
VNYSELGVALGYSEEQVLTFEEIRERGGWWGVM